MSDQTRVEIGELPRLYELLLRIHAAPSRQYLYRGLISLRDHHALLCQLARASRIELTLANGDRRTASADELERALAALEPHESVAEFTRIEPTQEWLVALRTTDEGRKRKSTAWLEARIVVPQLDVPGIPSRRRA